MSQIQSQIQSKTENQNFETKVESKSGHLIVSDEPETSGGGNKGMSPDELLLASLASCTSATLKMYAQHKKWDLQGVKTTIRMNTGKRPSDFESIDRIVELEGNLDEKQRERLLQIANKCPVHKLLSSGIEVHSDLKK